MDTVRITACAVGLALAASAFAGEERVKLKDGKGLDKVRQDCNACHSLDYIPLNSPFLDRKGWEATVTKMNKAFAAPIPPDDVAVLVDYLDANYGKR